MLTDAQVTRYSRQILLPEVGGLGQERILSARVSLRGTGPAFDAARRYLSAAGVAEVGSDPRAPWIVHAIGAARAGPGLLCGDCLERWFDAQPLPPAPLAPAAALSAGALAGAQILLELADPVRASRPFAVRAYPEASPVRPPPTPGCPRCREAHG